MSDYSKITNFLSKDSLSLNDPAKYVKGSEIDAEFNAIAVAIANKADTASPTLTTPILGVATATSINKITLTQPATGATLTLTDGKTFSVAKTLTLTGTDGTTMTFPGTSASVARIDEAQTFAGLQTFGAGLTVSGAAFNSRGITDNATAKALTLSGSGANSVTIANSATNPTIGTSAGALLLAPATGFVQLNGVTTSGLLLNAATGNSALVAMYVNGTEVARIIAGAAENLLLGTSSTGTPQVSVTHTASADRYITLTGSNGANPKIGTSAGQLTLGTGSALATSATEGYVCIPTCAGTPTGVPAGAGAGNLPLIYDTTNNKLYAYNGAWKATAALT